MSILARLIQLALGQDAGSQSGCSFANYWGHPGALGQFLCFADASNAPALSPTTRMGLFVSTPHRIEQTADGKVIYINAKQWTLQLPKANG